MSNTECAVSAVICVVDPVALFDKGCTVSAVNPFANDLTRNAPSRRSFVSSISCCNCQNCQNNNYIFVVVVSRISTTRGCQRVCCAAAPSTAPHGPSLGQPSPWAPASESHLCVAPCPTECLTVFQLERATPSRRVICVVNPIDTGRAVSAVNSVANDCHAMHKWNEQHTLGEPVADTNQFGKDRS